MLMAACEGAGGESEGERGGGQTGSQLEAADGHSDTTTCHQPELCVCVCVFVRTHRFAANNEK